jgi:lipid-A-disaccharide synthase
LEILKYAKDILTFQPDVIIFIDYPGLTCASQNGLEKSDLKHITFLTSNLGLEENRIKEIKRDVDKMYVILPFEKIFMK